MKKILSLALLLMMVTGLAVAASAITTVDLSVPKVSKTPVIDGKFDPDEGWGDPVSVITFDQMDSNYISDDVWEGDEEILPQSVATYLLWDETHLYFCSVIVDPIHYYDTIEGDLGNAYAGDGFQFDIKSMADDDTGNRNRYFYGLNVDEGYIVVNQDKVEFDAEAVGADEPGWTACAITRDEDTQTTVYETAFDLSLNLPEQSVSEGDQFYARARQYVAAFARTEVRVHHVQVDKRTGTVLCRANRHVQRKLAFSAAETAQQHPVVFHLRSPLDRLSDNLRKVSDIHSYCIKIRRKSQSLLRNRLPGREAESAFFAPKLY